MFARHEGRPWLPARIRSTSDARQVSCCSVGRLAGACFVRHRAGGKQPPVPPENALKLSAIIATVEQRDAFHYVSDIEWNDDGYYDVVYFTTDKAKVEMKIDAVTGKTR